MNTPCQTERSTLDRLVRRTGIALAALVLLASSLLAYVVKLKDGTLVFARAPYTVKGTQAIITLENGNVTQIAMDKVDVPGTIQYNKENFGNVVAIEAPEEKPKQLPTAPPRSNNPLGDLIKQRGTRMGLPTPGPAAPAAAAGAAAKSDEAAADPVYQSAFTQVFQGAEISQFRVASARGKTRILVTADSEQAVFSTLSAAARALRDAFARGRSASVEIVLTTSSGEPAGTFDMSPAQAKLLVDKNLTVQEYFVKNVIF
ncbi:MAG: hypothetical protein ABJC28_04665 [Acidobacteriota bacterium]